MNDHDDDAYLITPCSPSKVAGSSVKDSSSVQELVVPIDDGISGSSSDGADGGAGGDRGAGADGADGDGAKGAGASADAAEGAVRNALVTTDSTSEVIISKYFVVELVEEIVVDAITIANFEFYSSGVHEFDVYGSSERPIGSIIGTRSSSEVGGVGSGANGGVLHESELMRDGSTWVKLNKASFP